MEFRECAALFADRYYGRDLGEVRDLGGGFYGRAWYLTLQGGGVPVVVKAYRFPELHRRERDQLKMLKKHALLRVPETYFVHDGDGEIPMDLLVMEYLPGRNAGLVENLPQRDLDHIGGQIVDNLLALHGVGHPAGFGELKSGKYQPDWNRYYHTAALSHLEKARALFERRELSRETFETCCLALEHYDGIFSLPVESARLIHGDYTTWNIMLNESLTEATALIDPFGCMWADPELDLYQLNNVNGRDYKLLERYRAAVPLSPNFEVKYRFYELFTEIMHYHDASVPVAKSHIPEQAASLHRAMAEFGIL